MLPHAISGVSLVFTLGSNNSFAGGEIDLGNFTPPPPDLCESADGETHRWRGRRRTKKDFYVAIADPSGARMEKIDSWSSSRETEECDSGVEETLKHEKDVTKSETDGRCTAVSYKNKGEGISQLGDIVIVTTTESEDRSTGQVYNYNEGEQCVIRDRNHDPTPGPWEETMEDLMEHEGLGTIQNLKEQAGWARDAFKVVTKTAATSTVCIGVGTELVGGYVQVYTAGADAACEIGGRRHNYHADIADDGYHHTSAERMLVDDFYATNDPTEFIAEKREQTRILKFIYWITEWF